VERSTGETNKLFDNATIMMPPRWQISPDGRRIAGLNLNDARRLQLYVGDIKAGTLRQVTREDRLASNFFGWSLDGRKLLYYFTREPAQPKAGDAFHEFIAVIDADGRNRTELHDNERHYNAQGQKQVLDYITWADWR
jgi:Tol biopolymer transport system component